MALLAAARVPEGHVHPLIGVVPAMLVGLAAATVAELLLLALTPPCRAAARYSLAAVVVPEVAAVVLALRERSVAVARALNEHVKRSACVVKSLN
jgi:hypothetical protein